MLKNILLFEMRDILENVGKFLNVLASAFLMYFQGSYSLFVMRFSVFLALAEVHTKSFCNSAKS